MVLNIRSSILCLASLVAYTNAGFEKRQDTSAAPSSQQPFTSTLPPETSTVCCSGTITQETTIAKAGPTYVELTTVTHQVDYFTYWIEANSTISSVTSTALNTTLVSNSVPRTVPSTANPDPGIRTLNSLPSPCCTILVTRTLTYDPVKQTAVYYRDRVETAFTVTSTTTVETPSAAPVVQIQDGQVQNNPGSSNASAVSQINDGQAQAAPAGNTSASTSAPAQSPPAAQAKAPVDQVSKFALGLFIGGAVVALL